MGTRVTALQRSMEQCTLPPPHLTCLLWQLPRRCTRSRRGAAGRRRVVSGERRRGLTLRDGECAESQSCGPYSVKRDLLQCQRRPITRDLCVKSQSRGPYVCQTLLSCVDVGVEVSVMWMCGCVVFFRHRVDSAAAT